MTYNPSDFVSVILAGFDARITAAENPTPTPTPAPAFTVQPSISPSSGVVGTMFSGSDGTITNGAVSARQWLLNGSAIGGATGASYVSAAPGSLTYSVTATGVTAPDAVATSTAATVTPTPITLGALSLVGTLTEATLASGVTITGATAGSTITLNIAGLTVSGAGTTRTVSGTPGAAGALSVTETLAGATNTPRVTALGSVAAGVTFTQPYNYVFVPAPGDSRIAQGGGWNGLYGDGLIGTLVGMDAHLATFANNIIRPGRQVNPGLGGQTALQALGYPRSASQNAQHTGSVASTGTNTGTLTVTAFTSGGTIQPGMVITLVNPFGTYMGFVLPYGTNGTTGTGGNGTYALDTTNAGATSSASGPITNSYAEVISPGLGRTIADTARNPAAMAFLSTGANDAGGGAAALQAVFTRVAAVVASLTDPAVPYPNYRPNGASTDQPLPLFEGRPKNIILFTDYSRGVSATGQTPGLLAQATAAAYRDYNRALMGLSYDAVGSTTFGSTTVSANPRVIGINIFDDPLLLDTSDTTNYRNKPGVLTDGLHLIDAGAWNVAKIAGPRLLAALSPANDFAQLPTTATTGQFVTNNPCFATTTGGASGLTGTLVGTVPSGWRLLNGVTGLTVTITYTALGGNLGNEMTVRLQGTGLAAGGIIIDQATGTFANAGDVATARWRARMRHKMLITTGKLVSFALGATIGRGTGNNGSCDLGHFGRSTNYAGTAGYTQFVNSRENGGAGPGNYPDADPSHADFVTEISKNFDIIAAGLTGAPTVATIALGFNWAAGDVDMTFAIAQCGAGPVSN